METLFNLDGKQKKTDEESDSVYVLDVDKSVFDPREPSFTQMHLLRFEYERSMG